MDNKRIKLTLALLLNLFWISGCSSFLSQQQNLSSWQTRQTNMRALTQWTLRGKLIIKQHDQSKAGTLYWKQNQEQFHIQLSGPIGMGKIILKTEPQGFSVTSTQGKVLFANIEQALNYYQLPELPIEAIKYWAKGIPAPLHPVTHLTLKHQLAQTFEQQNYFISYRNYANFDNTLLPTKIHIHNNHHSLQLILNRWNF